MDVAKAWPGMLALTLLAISALLSWALWRRH